MDRDFVVLRYIVGEGLLSNCYKTNVGFDGLYYRLINDIGERATDSLDVVR